LRTSGGGLGGLRRLHLFSRNDGIWRAVNYRFIALEAGNNLNSIAEIVTRRYRCERDVAIFYYSHLQTLRAKYQSGGRNEKRRGLSRNLQMHLSIGAEKQLAAGIIHVNSHIQGASGSVDGV